MFIEIERINGGNALINLDLVDFITVEDGKTRLYAPDGESHVAANSYEDLRDKVLGNNSAALAAIEGAEIMLNKLCLPKSEGGIVWAEEISFDGETDPANVISKALCLAKALLS